MGRFVADINRRARGRIANSAWRRQAARFYRPLIPPRSLVFDVGANVGNYSRVFRDLGASVVAVEPQPDLARRIRRFRGISVEQVALGAKPARANLRLAQAHTIASLSVEWIAAVRSSGRFAEYDWADAVEVQVSTLDALIEHYGEPAFLKIDVEGYEADVLSGLSRPLALIAFEHTPEFAGNTERCLEKLAVLGEYEYAFGAGRRLALSPWCRGRLLPDEVGDLYARLLDGSGCVCVDDAEHQIV